MDQDYPKLFFFFFFFSCSNLVSPGRLGPFERLVWTQWRQQMAGVQVVFLGWSVRFQLISADFITFLTPHREWELKQQTEEKTRLLLIWRQGREWKTWILCPQRASISGNWVTLTFIHVYVLPTALDVPSFGSGKRPTYFLLLPKKKKVQLIHCTKQSNNKS